MLKEEILETVMLFLFIGFVFEYVILHNYGTLIRCIAKFGI